MPIAAITHALGMGVIYCSQFVLGCKEVVARVAAQSFIPIIVGRSHLVEANARMETSSSLAAIVGPGAGGVLVEVLTAPIALAVDTLSYFISAALLTFTNVTERTRRSDDVPGLRAEIAQGLRVVLTTSRLRALMLGGTIHNFGSRMIDALFILYAVEWLKMGPAEVGLVLAAGGPGALLGAATVGRLGARLGVGQTIAWAQVLTGVSRLLIPLAGGPGLLAIGLLGGSNFLLGFSRTAFNVSQVSLRVALTPDHLHGRVNASIRFLMWSITPIGALTGGLLASAVGLRSTMLFAGIAVLLATIPLLAHDLRAIREIPAAALGS